MHCKFLFAIHHGRRHTFVVINAIDRYQHCIRAATRGFSLIELTIALGIVGFAVVSIIGLLPIGLKAFQDAARLNVEAEIVQQITREVEATPFAQLTDYGSSGSPLILGFDAEGRELEDLQGASASQFASDDEAAFRVQVEMADATVQGKLIQAQRNGTATTVFRVARIWVQHRREFNQTRAAQPDYIIHVADKGY